ncbi:MAG: hypothetical protein WD852_03535 [Methyloceanibacter sp.]
MGGIIRESNVDGPRNIACGEATRVVDADVGNDLLFVNQPAESILGSGRRVRNHAIYAKGFYTQIGALGDFGQTHLTASNADRSDPQANVAGDEASGSYGHNRREEGDWSPTRRAPKGFGYLLLGLTLLGGFITLLIGWLLGGFRCE